MGQESSTHLFQSERQKNLIGRRQRRQQYSLNRFSHTTSGRSDGNKATREARGISRWQQGRRRIGQKWAEPLYHWRAFSKEMCPWCKATERGVQDPSSYQVLHGGAPRPREGTISQEETLNFLSVLCTMIIVWMYWMIIPSRIQSGVCFCDRSSSPEWWSGGGLFFFASLARASVDSVAYCSPQPAHGVG